MTRDKKKFGIVWNIISIVEQQTQDASRFANFRLYFVECEENSSLLRSALPFDRMCSPGRDAAVEKGNETSPALLYLPFSLCRCQNAPSSYRVFPPEEQKRESRWGLAVGELGQREGWTTKIGRTWRRDSQSFRNGQSDTIAQYFMK